MSTTLPSEVFFKSEFWYKIGVDFEETVPGSEPEEGNEEIFAENLLDEFVKRKRHIILDEFNDIEGFKQKVKKGTDSRSDLFRIYTRYLWSQKKGGEKFQPEGTEISKCIEQLSEGSDAIFENVDDDFSILWPAEDTLQTEVNKNQDEVVGRKFLEAKPVILKKSAEEFEVRGRAGDKKSVLSDLRKQEDILEKDTEEVSESIAEQIQDLLTSKNDFFKILGIEFADSELPHNPRLDLKANSAIYDDIKQLQEYGLISIKGMSEVRKLKLQDKRTGSNFRVKVIRSDNTFRFDLVANRKTDSERKRLRANFEEVTDIEFEKRYNYSSQADERFIFNRILAESSETYKKYFEQLDSEIKELIEELVHTKEITKRFCRNCGAASDSNKNVCEDCGTEDLFEASERIEVDVDERKTFRKMLDVISDCSPECERFSISNWSVEEDEFGSGQSERKVALASMQITDMEGREATISYYEIYFVSIGNRRKPPKLDDYLLNSVLMTFGDSRDRVYNGFGSLTFYDLLLNEDSDIDSLIGEEVYEAVVRVSERVNRKSYEARSDGQKLLNKMAELDSYSDNKGILKQICRSNGFEKAVFYLMRRMFPYSERLGKAGKKEPDNLLIIPFPDKKDFVATGDAKLSYSDNGYNLGTSEADKASRYILSAVDDDRIQNKTQDSGIHAHLFISQNFRDTQFDTAAENIKQNLDDSGRESVENVDLVFIEFEALIQLSEMYERFYREMNDSHIRRSFNECLAEEFSSSDEYVYFDTEAAGSVKEQLINRIDDLPDSRVSHYSE
jgi:hypothetical protein